MDSHNFRGAMLMLVAMAAFTTNDAITKWITSEIGSGQTMLVRGLFAVLFLGLIAWRQGALRDLRRYFRKRVLLRTSMEMAGTGTFFIGLPHLPIATVSAIYQSLPLVVTLGAAMFLGEKVGWRRWSAILIGLGGVMLIIRPGSEGFNIFAAWMVASVLFSAVRDVVTRRIEPGTPVSGIAALTSLAVAGLGAVMVPFEGGLQPLTGSMVFGLIAAAGLLTIAYQAIIAAMQVGEISFVAPFRYVSLIIAIVIGYFAFSEVPDAWMLAGSTIVVASGIYTLYRERVRKVRPIAAESTARPVLAPVMPHAGPDHPKGADHGGRHGA